MNGTREGNRQQHIAGTIRGPVVDERLEFSPLAETLCTAAAGEQVFKHTFSLLQGWKACCSRVVCL